MAENWAEAYYRILGEVERDMPDADDFDQYAEYERRVEFWKAENLPAAEPDYMPPNSGFWPTGTFDGQARGYVAEPYSPSADNLPCPVCGGDRLRQNFTDAPGCHAPMTERTDVGIAADPYQENQ